MVGVLQVSILYLNNQALKFFLRDTCAPEALLIHQMQQDLRKSVAFRLQTQLERIEIKLINLIELFVMVCLNLGGSYQ